MVSLIDRPTIRFITETIANSFSPEKIYLFGSYAAQSENADSDLDFLIIMDSALPRHYRGSEIRKSFLNLKVPVDIIVYTPEEFESEKNESFTFINKILKSAQLVYERKDK